MAITIKSNHDPRDTKNHAYVNLFVQEYYHDEILDDSTPYVTWCIGPVKDGIFYGIQVSKSDLLPDEKEVLVVELNHCELLTSTSNNMPDYFFELEDDQAPRDSDKLHFQVRDELPSGIRLDIIKALKEHQNHGRAIMSA